MIRESDLDFHTPTDPPHDWAETGYFNIYVPERNLFCWLYYVHRAGVGITVTDIEILDRWSDTVDDALYVDYTNHNPLPTNARRFSLPSGLSFEAKSLKEYVLDYRGRGVELHLDLISIMSPMTSTTPRWIPWPQKMSRKPLPTPASGQPTHPISTCRSGHAEP